MSEWADETRFSEIPGDPVRVGIIGCGFISGIYLQNAPRWPNLTIVACADVAPERARERAAEFGVAKALSPEALLADPDIELVLDLTNPAAHAPIALEAIAAGKAVYNEKPLATLLEDGRRIVTRAAATGVLTGCAPDTFLGGGLQTCRALIDARMIGEPVAATAFFQSAGHEHWHPQPDFFYQQGGGPMLDMGPYYLTALVSMLGPVRRVTGSARASYPERTISSEPRAGGKIAVEVPTHLAGVLDFASGPIATVVTSFDIWRGQVPHLEIYGSEGTLSLPDPNTFGGPIQLRRAGSNEWEDVPVTWPYTDNSRGLGLADLAAAMRTGARARASGELALHVLEIMHAVETASNTGQHVQIESTIDRPAPFSD